MAQTRLQKIKYLIYRFKCWLFGHKYSCCPEVMKRCSKCEWVIKENEAERRNSRETEIPK